MIWDLGLCNKLISPEKERTIVLMKSQTIKYRGLLYCQRRSQLQTNNSSWHDCLLSSILLLLVVSSFLLCVKVANAQPGTLKDMLSYERISQDGKSVWFADPQPLLSTQLFLQQTYPNVLFDFSSLRGILRFLALVTAIGLIGYLVYRRIKRSSNIKQ